MDVRLVTWQGAGPAGDYDSRPLLAELRELGLHADIRPWSDAAVDWADAAVTVIRSTWDYHEDRPRFLDWVDRTASVTRLYNRPDVIRWNSDKRYLLDLERAGIDIVPTLVAEADTVRAERQIRERGWTDVVLKPAISLDGHGVCRAAVDTAELRSALQRIAAEGPIIVQPFMPGIIDAGEISHTFIDGRFSHTVRKNPAPGEFRVQERLGGSVRAAPAPAGSVEFAQSVLATLEETPLYARVDIIEGDTTSPFLLTELELVEPSLFLETHGPAAASFARAIASRIRR